MSTTIPTQQPSSQPKTSQSSPHVFLFACVVQAIVALLIMGSCEFPGGITHRSPAPVSVPHDEPLSGVVSAAPDDRLILWLNAFGANFHRGPDISPWDAADRADSGVGAWWRGERAVLNLIDRIDDARKAGIKTVIINRIAGELRGTSHPTAAVWGTLPRYKQQLLHQQLKPYLARHKDIQVWLYTGSSWESPDQLWGYNKDRHGEPYPGSAHTPGTNRSEWRTQIRDPWIEIGIRGFVFDWSSSTPNRQWLVELAHEEAQHDPPMTIWGEAIPRGENASMRRATGWIGLVRFVRNSSIPFDYEVKDGETMGVILSHEPRDTDYVTLGTDFHRRGWYVLGNVDQLKAIQQRLLTESD